MGKRTRQFSFVGVAAAAIFAATTITSAHAAGGTYTAGCSTTGADGGVKFTNATVFYTDISMWVSDESSDGHHVAIRFVSNDTNSTKYWPWHHEYGGSGTTLIVTTSASDSGGGLNYLGVQVATMEGSTVVHSCTGWVGGGTPP